MSYPYQLPRLATLVSYFEKWQYATLMGMEFDRERLFKVTL